MVSERGQLEQGLTKALADGLSALNVQLKALLALSKLNDSDAMPILYPDTPASAAEARLLLLITLAADAKLYPEIEQLDDEAARLRLMLRLMQAVPQEERLHSLWEQVNKLQDAALRSHLLLQFIPLLKQAQGHQYEEAYTSYLKETITLAQNIQNTEARVRCMVALAAHLLPEERVSLLKSVVEYVNKSGNDTIRANSVNTLLTDIPPELVQPVLACAELIKSPVERAWALAAMLDKVETLTKPRVIRQALEATMLIPQEDERANALILLAPHLESAKRGTNLPEHLEGALKIAVGLQKRSSRAKALVALASHLPSDLQGEALAAVHSVGSERERAQLLSELAPTLPGDMLVASLMVAHTMQEQDARVHALIVLAHHVPAHTRLQTLLDALAAASNLPHQYERVRALVNLMDILPSHLKDQAYTNALETTRLIDNESARARAFSLLGGHLPPEMLLRGLPTIYQIKDPQQRLNAIISAMPHLPEAAQAEVRPYLLETVRQISMDYKRARSLVTIAPHLTPELTVEALTMTDALDDPVNQVSGYVALAPKLSTENKQTAIAKAWKLIKKIDEGYDRSNALLSISTLLPPSAHDDLAREASEVIQSIGDEYDRASAIRQLAPLLAQGRKKVIPVAELFDKFSLIHDALKAVLDIPQQSVKIHHLGQVAAAWVTLEANPRFALWQDMVPRLAKLPYADVLLAIKALLPVIESFLSPEQQQEIAEIIRLR